MEYCGVKLFSQLWVRVLDLSKGARVEVARGSVPLQVPLAQGGANQKRLVVRGI